MILSALRHSDRGMTRLESNLLVAVLVIGAVIGASVLFRTYSSAVGETEHATVQDGQPFTHQVAAEAPIAVNVVAAGTIAQPLAEVADDGVDTCAELPGVQPAGFDCSLPVYVPALDLAASHVKGRYQCADRTRYQLVGGQSVQPGKLCVLKTVQAAQP